MTRPAASSPTPAAPCGSGERPANRRLTFKGPARFEQGIKTREERETSVGSAEEAEAILLRLGFVRRFRYEKRREEWRLFGCAVALDETPIGNFVEIEGDPLRHPRGPSPRWSSTSRRPFPIPTRASTR